MRIPEAATKANLGFPFAFNGDWNKRFLAELASQGKGATL
jgi:hypothetical protein